jgi:hypothetical protein
MVQQLYLIRNKEYEANNKEILFLLCRFCLWCASLIQRSVLIAKCPSCNSDDIAAMPLAGS